MTRLDLSALPSLVKSRTLKRFCRKGIPMTHRAKIWYGSFHLINIPCADTNSTTAVAAEARVNPALPATAVVESKAKRPNLYPLTVLLLFELNTKWKCLFYYLLCPKIDPSSCFCRMAVSGAEEKKSQQPQLYEVRSKYLFSQGIFWNSIKVVVILAFFRQCLASQRIRIQLWLSRSQSTFREPSLETFISLRSLPQTRKNSRYSTSS